ncbi:N-formylglutamate amidohydrolase [Poseidonocella sedimentorum]|uniref:Predicted N-formylglutamate amidohydrolase n=1 Tax=Poseidonocella sedimentorum TaxID=871652 RepID=A0A1I6E4X1_9RHOB|nr:N-formylglutamate amidohydrolase [Poseidonocella sedimentorum]SFR12766.1 Predicted N-formylglutamate amidohydrolase [Poseidonocella sedimentorum]
MTHADPIPLASAPDAPVALLRGAGAGPVCLVCEHASAAIPPALGDLGLAAADRLAHAVWDPGAEALTRALSERLDAPALLSTVSRLVHDCNRPAGDPTACPAQVERIAVPGNAGLSEADRLARAEAVHAPFHDAVSALLEGREGATLMTVHSFTPAWNGVARDVELGLLHDADARLAEAMLARAPTEIATALNEPYAARDGVTYTLARHAVPRGIPNVMIEVRNDLLADAWGVSRMADHLAAMLSAALAEGALA